AAALARRSRGAERPARAARRAVQWCRDVAVAADAVVMKGRWHLGGAYEQVLLPAYAGPKEALRALRTERPVLVEAVCAADEFGFPDLVWELCEAMWGLHLRLGFHSDCLRTHALGVEAAKEFPDPRIEARMRVQRGFSLMALQREAEAEEDFRTAHEREPETHPRGRATAVESLGLLRLRQRRWAEAEALFETARGYAARAGDARADALLEHHAGRALAGQGRLAEAVTRCEAALRSVRGLPQPDPYNEARVLTSIGEAHLDAAAPRSARTPLTRALEIMTRQGALLQEAVVAELCARCAEPGSPEQRELRRRALGLHVTTGDDVGAERVGALLAE
ncbi:MAG: tetratricopeptide repeat protein, partial [Streptomyces sp.]|uniref:tetratricopeptide repeat protein n=1 Tax=Streptomyces sp. TaxID=1931 RepID=UPI003D6A7F7F